MSKENTVMQRNFIFDNITKRLLPCEKEIFEKAVTESNF